MQRNRTLVVLGMIFLGLLAFLMLRSSVSLTSSDKDEYMGVIEGLNADGVYELVLSQSEEVMGFEKNENTWMVDDYEADVNKVSEFIKSLLIPGEVEVVSETTTKHDVFEVNEELGVKVELKMNEEQRTFFLGGSSSGGRYVRFEGEDRVFLVLGLPTNTGLFDNDVWIDATLTRIPEDKMERVVIYSNDGEVSLQQREGEWYEQGSELALDETGLASMLDTLSTLVTQGIDEGKIESEEPYMIVKVEKVEAEPIELEFYEGDDEVVKVTSSSRKGVFKIPATTADNFELTEVDLKLKEEAENSDVGEGE